MGFAMLISVMRRYFPLTYGFWEFLVKELLLDLIVQTKIQTNPHPRLKLPWGISLVNYLKWQKKQDQR
jgi:hypothetical protein